MKKLIGRAASAAVSLKVLTEAGIVRPYSPRALAGILLSVRRWGTGPAGGFAALAARSPDRVGLVDELGSLTFGELHRRSNALAHALSERGIGEGDSVAVMCRNHRGFVDASRGGRQARRRHPLPQHRVRRAPAGRRPRAGEAGRGHPRRGVHRAARGRRDRRPGDRLVRRPRLRRDDPRVADRDLSGHRPQAPRAAHAHRDPDLRHHGHAQGRAAQRGRHRRRGRAALTHPAAPRLAHPHRGAALPHLGLRAPRPGDAARAPRSCCGASSTPSRRCASCATRSAGRWS